MKAKVFIVVISLVLTLSVGGVALASTLDLVGEQEPEIVFSVWGDSIAEAVLGASPIGERDGFGYYGLVGRIANFEFHNRSVSGHLTGQFYEYISRPDDGARMNNTLLKTSDIIAVSILGNDLLQNDVSQMVVDYSNGINADLDANVAIAKSDFKLALDYIKEINPNAKVLVQTVYNPMFVGSHILMDSARDALYAKGLNDAQIREMGGYMLDALNGIVFDYLEENPGSITVIDVRKEFDKIYDADNARGAELFYNDGVHPSNEGHAVIAGLYLEKMVEWGYVSESKVLKNYKNIRVDQLERLYSEEDTASVIKDVRGAKSYDEITNAFFRFAEDKTAVLNEKATKDNPYVAFEETKRFYIENASVIGMPIEFVLKSKESFVEFYDDGTMKIQLMLGEGSGELLSGLLGDMDLSSVDISPIVGKYAVELFPGFTTDKVMYSLGLLEDNLGLSFVGFDTEHEGIQALINSLEKDGKLPSTLTIPEGLGIQYEGRYTIREVVNPLTGEEMTQVHMGAPYKNGDGYVIMTYQENENGKEEVYFSIDFIQINVKAIER
ncbi:MAG: SGNH/GDSL hydrolase family protein [Clostridia bacterium]|nr:SGNH/GDSL hydrolase family protein [Clostridia bacterium]